MAAKKKSSSNANAYALADQYLPAAMQKVAAARVAAPKPAAPAAPPPPPAPAPFLTGQNMTQDADFWANNQAQMDQAKFDLDNVLPQLEYQKTTNNTDAKQASTQATDDMAGRGLFQSSIKDAALADVEAQRALREGLFNTQISTARDQYALKAKALGDAADNWKQSMNQVMLDNARAQSATQSLPAPAATAPQTTQASGGYKNVVRGGTFGHLYPDGRFVPMRPAS